MTPPADQPPSPDLSGETVALLVLARPTFDVELAGSLVARATKLLERTGAQIAGSARLLMDDDDVRAALDALRENAPTQTLVVQATFTDAAAVVRIAERHATLPLALWAFPEPREGGRLRLNAFCGLNLAAHALGRIDRSAGMLYAAPDDDALPALRELLAGGRVPATPPIGPAEVASISPAAARAANAVHGARIGRIGEHPAGFDTCDYDERRLKALADIHVEPIELDDVFETAGKAGSAAVERVRAQATRDCGSLSGLDEGEVERSLRLKCALDDVRERGRFDAFAVRCWPECFTQYGGAMCGPVSMMGEARVPCACEADVYGAITGLVMQSLAEAPAFLVDLVDLDAGDDTGVVWHCGQAPISMSAGHASATEGALGETGEGAAPARPTVHTNRKMALLYEFALRPGRVTLARISQARGRHQMVIAGGDMLERPGAFTGTSGTMRFDAPAGRVMDTILGGGVEHHMSLAYGDYRAELREVAAELGLPVMVI